MAGKKSLPSIQKLAIDAWELFKETWVTYIKLSGLAIAYVFLAIIVGLLLILPAIFAGAGTHFAIFSHPSPFTIFLGILFILWFILFFLSVVAIDVIFPIASIFILQGKNPAKIFDLIKSTKPFFWSYFLVSLLTSFLVLGGAMLLVIPGLLIGFFLSFVLYEVVIDNHKGRMALKHSYFMVKNNFWEVFTRLVLLELALFIITSVMNRIATRDLLLGLLQFLFSLFTAWYTRAYTFILYKDVRARTTFPQEISINWIWIVSVIGWVIGVLFLVGFSIGIMHLPHAQPSHMNRVSPGAV
jgi:hypothetical protein